MKHFQEYFSILFYTDFEKYSILKVHHIPSILTDVKRHN